MARSLAIFATPDGMQTFRLPNHLKAHVQVADRFFVKPLLRSITCPHFGYVIALSQNETRLLEVLPEGASYRLEVDDLPRSMDHALASMGVGGRAPRGKISGAEGAKIRMVQNSRKINQALRSVLDGEPPLIIAGTEPLRRCVGPQHVPPLEPTDDHRQPRNHIRRRPHRPGAHNPR